ncbi:hypothetical protein A2661_01655 [Candidatus Giovannonibacteria bacterium RIFCSPHIGHO2_01_FULL_45_24]|uniref:Uncharacterized protein n=1 Tax=Candidatus Giovannonibacteria bacterium RIFCSPLOWO2_01_FULL_46_32 TaxID=1798353 RepID=A0A1F5XH53_9BACT|nr:MAG: hypothetical protein A2661_01655 [Candidatus Giovannonibacteria bacterium RIFCSPHIGHO2_01_FULL_45_24]OGF87272.1 MAG: hypothetical protein A3B19_03530 [Candidatus Giovannonibacteria bacterium RIFCSPLOWO2_01_FULL_46_32]
MIDEKQFLKGLREAVRKLRCKSVLERDSRLRFRLGDGDGGRYCPITLLCVHRRQIFYNPSFEVRKAARLVKIRAALREKINHAADRYPGGYDRRLRRRIMRAAGRW